MKKEIYINGEIVETTKTDIKVLEKYFNIVEEYKEFESNDLTDVHYIKSRKVFTNSKDMLEFVMFLEANGFNECITRSTSSPCKIIGVKKDAYTKGELRVVDISWMLFYNKKYSDDLFAFTLDDMLDMSIQNLDSYDWIFDIEWKYNKNRNTKYTEIIHNIVALINKFDLKYTSTSKRKITVLKTNKKK